MHSLVYWISMVWTIKIKGEYNFPCYTITNFHHRAILISNFYHIQIYSRCIGYCNIHRFEITQI